MQRDNASFSNKQILIFMLELSFVCAVILAVFSSALYQKKIEAKELDRTKEMLVAARIYDNNRKCFLVEDNGQYVPAEYVEKGRLVPSKEVVIATPDEILQVVRARTHAVLVDDRGVVYSFKEAGVSEQEYISSHKKEGYAHLPLKLVYELSANPDSEGKRGSIIGYIIPVSGFGLWDFIYGYIALKTDGETVIGISWYEQKETPGLGANIAESSWQKQFAGKLIFQPDSSGTVDMQRGSIGIQVVRGKVKEVVGSVPKAENCVDGIAGATLTGNGVTKAYKDTLTPYREFFVRLHEQEKK